MIDTVIFSTEASGTFNYTPLPYLFSSHISRIQMGEQQNFPTSGRRAKWSISYILYSQKISEPLAKFHSHKVVASSPQTCMWRTRGPEESKFELTTLSCISGCTWVMFFPLQPLWACVKKVTVCLKEGSLLLFANTCKSHSFQEQTVLCKAVEKHLLISTEKSTQPCLREWVVL